MRTIMSYPAAFLGAALMLSLSACTTQFISGVSSGPTETSGGGDGGGGGTTGVTSSVAQSTSTGGPTLLPLPAKALTGAQQNALEDQYWNTTYGEAGPGSYIDSNDLYLHISDLGVSCAYPPPSLPCGSHYDMSFALSPALQQVGVYDLDSTKTAVQQVGHIPGGDPMVCYYFSSFPSGGSLEIISIDPTQVHFRLSITAPLFDTDPSGEFIATRCP